MNPLGQWHSTRQGVAVDQAAVPTLPPEAFSAQVSASRQRGGRLANLFARRGAHDAVRLYAIVAFDASGTLELCAADLPGEAPAYPSIAATCPAAQAFEREIAEQYAVRPEGHPWLKPLRYHPPDRGTQPWGRFDPAETIPGNYPFFRVEGEEIHEVAVGPVHAGIIEPGHFRFQCHGEQVLHLEVVLGYQHRGAEALLAHPNPVRAILAAETVAGDSSIGHATAYCAAIEALGGTIVSPRAHAIRAIALELERLANHVGDLGALGADIGFLPTNAFLGRLRGDFLNLTCEICGNRFGRSLLRPGGILVDIDPALAQRLRLRLLELQTEVIEVLELFFSTPTVLARLEGVGILTAVQAADLGLVGPVARACGLGLDVRHDHPHGAYQFSHIPVAIEPSGDVYARAAVRWLEVQRSIEFLLEMLAAIPAGSIRAAMPSLRPNALAIGMAETWRGEAMHVAFTGADGSAQFVKAKDPSLHNWFGLAMAMRDQLISDFPLCNKSFSLSYAGHDL